MNEMKKTALFDFDGVIADTEPIYSEFWGNAAQRYRLEYEDFPHLIKGTTMPFILKTYFANHTQAEIDRLCRELQEFEIHMPFPLIAGSLDFIRMLKAHGVQVGLVTSSDNSKMANAFRALPIQELFDTIVTADRITQGKPDPMCYLLGAADLKTDPADCLVFEDSFNGIKAADAAGMRVIGVSSTNPVEALKDLVFDVIPDFMGLDMQRFKQW